MPHFRSIVVNAKSYKYKIGRSFICIIDNGKRVVHPLQYMLGISLEQFNKLRIVERQLAVTPSQVCEFIKSNYLPLDGAMGIKCQYCAKFDKTSRFRIDEYKLAARSDTGLYCICSTCAHNQWMAS